MVSITVLNGMDDVLNRLFRMNDHCTEQNDRMNPVLKSAERNAQNTEHIYDHCVNRMIAVQN